MTSPLTAFSRRGTWAAGATTASSARTSGSSYSTATGWIARSWSGSNGGLRDSTEEWTICDLHHPLYSGGAKHGPELELRVLLEPLLVQYGVDVVFSGHDHVYERVRPQQGVHYFVVGPGGQEPRTLQRSAETAASFEGEQNFMLVEVSGDALSFHAVSRSGTIVDTGTIRPRPKASSPHRRAP
jgi:hypothetical protein